jgi:hypothetical protein
MCDIKGGDRYLKVFPGTLSVPRGKRGFNFQTKWAKKTDSLWEKDFSVLYSLELMMARDSELNNSSLLTSL